jgi:hypothetical protein
MDIWLKPQGIFARPLPLDKREGIAVLNNKQQVNISTPAGHISEVVEQYVSGLSDTQHLPDTGD